MGQTGSQEVTDTCEQCVAPGLSQEALVHNEDGSTTHMCVKCPFCHEIVNAHMTKTAISCPSCKVTVNY